MLLYDSKILKTAFNASFERTCLSVYFGRVTPPEQWSCTAVMARELGLPGSLEAVGEVIGLPEDKQKSKTGKTLIRYFILFRARPQKSMEEEQETCRSMTPTAGIFTLNITGKTLRQNALFAKSYLVFQYLRMSSRFGFTTSISMTAVSEWTSILQKKAIEIDGIIKGRLFEQAKELTGLDNPKSTAQLKGWIEDTAGIEVESLNKKSIAGVRAEADNKKVDAMLDIRAGLSKTSTEKYNAMLRTACADGRIRGLTQFYGASRTGRWAGRLVQMQNLPQNKMPDRDLDTARQLVAKGDLKLLNCFLTIFQELYRSLYARHLYRRKAADLLSPTFQRLKRAYLRGSPMKNGAWTFSIHTEKNL